jgi:hypothetical protein
MANPPLGALKLQDQKYWYPTKHGSTFFSQVSETDYIWLLGIKKNFEFCQFVV